MSSFFIEPNPHGDLQFEGPYGFYVLVEGTSELSVMFTNRESGLGKWIYKGVSAIEAVEAIHEHDRDYERSLEEARLPPEMKAGE